MKNNSQDHSKLVTGIFTNIAGVYDLLNRVLSFGIDALWRKKQAAAVEDAAGSPEAVILDLAAGTMEVTKELSKRYPDAKIIAMDFCQPMLTRGQKKLSHIVDKSLIPVVGDALKLPLADASVDAITVAFGLRNFNPRDEAMREMHRVLKPGGMLCILEFGSARDRILLGLYNWYLANILPLVGKLVSKNKEAYQYLADTILAFPSAQELVEELEKKGFHGVSFSRYTAGIVCLHRAIK